MPRDISLREAIALATGTAVATTKRGRGVARLAGRAGLAIAKRHPYVATAVVLAELGYIYQDEIEDVARTLAERVPRPASGSPSGPTFSGEPVVPKLKRKLSKANKAMKQAMKATKNNFKQATKIASKANPATKSRIGRGTSVAKKLARKIRKSVWGVRKRFKK
jgi:hypothetical protein